MRWNAFGWMALAAILALALPASGQTWTGAGADDNWSTNENWEPDPDIPWEPGAPPSKDGTANVFFGAAGVGDSIVDLGVEEDPWAINGLTFQNDAGAFTLKDGPLAIGGGGIVNRSPATQTFAVDIVVGANQEWRTYSGSATDPFTGGPLHLTGMVDLGSHRIDVHNPDGEGNRIEFRGELKGDGDSYIHLGGTTWSVFLFDTDASEFEGTVVVGGSARRVWVNRDYALGSGVLRVTGFNRNDFYTSKEGEIRLANDIVLTSDCEMHWNGATWVVEGTTEIPAGRTYRMRGNAIHEGDVFGGGGLVDRRQGGISRLTFEGEVSILGPILWDWHASILTVNGVMTAGGMVDDGEGGEVFVPAGRLTISRTSVSTTPGAILRGTGEIYRDVHMTGVDHVYHDFFSDIYRVAGSTARLEDDLGFGGIVTLNNAAGSGNVTILDGGTLKGIGVIGGNVLILDGGALEPGTDIGYVPIMDGATIVGVEDPSPIGTLRLRPYSETFPEPTEEDPEPDPIIDPGSTLTFEPAATARFLIASLESHDRVEDIGTLNYGGTLAIELADGFVPEIGDTFDLFGFHARGEVLPLDEENDPVPTAFDAFDFPVIEGIAFAFDHETGVLSVVDPPSEGPVAENVAIDGEPVVGGTLTGSYDFTGDSDLSTYRWLRADTADGEYTAIDGATDDTYTLTQDDAGKFIAFEVTPIDSTGSGEVAESDPTGPVYVLGDFNGDGVLSGLDIPGFKQALADPDGWATANPDRPHPNLLGDFNGDGVFSGLDIPGFKQALAGN